MQHKVLLISHLATNSTNNVGKTLIELFNGYRKENLIQLFFNQTLPDADYCQSWFRITDREMLDSIFSGKPAGDSFTFSGENKQSDYQLSSNSKLASRGTVSLLGRDLIWRLGKYNKKALFSWVEEYQPDVVFLAPGYSCFAYDIAMTICRKFRIPLIQLYMDDYYNECKNPWNPLEWLRRYLIRKAIRTVSQYASSNIAISHEMAVDYSIKLGIHVDLLYTPSKHIVELGELRNAPRKKFMYAGGLELGRGEILLEIAKALDRCGTDASMYIYSMSKGIDVIQELKKIKCVKYMGFANSDVINQKISEVDVVLHVESFEPKNLKRTRFSISTKVPELLSAGKLLFVVGAETQSSILYLKNHQAAVVCSRLENLHQIVEEIIDEKNDYSEFIRNANRLARMNHSEEVIRDKMMQHIMKSQT